MSPLIFLYFLCRCGFQQPGGAQQSHCSLPGLWWSQWLWFWQDVPVAGKYCVPVPQSVCVCYVSVRERERGCAWECEFNMCVKRVFSVHVKCVFEMCACMEKYCGHVFAWLHFYVCVCVCVLKKIVGIFWEKGLLLMCDVKLSNNGGGVGWRWGGGMWSFRYSPPPPFLFVCFVFQQKQQTFLSVLQYFNYILLHNSMFRITSLFSPLTDVSFLLLVSWKQGLSTPTINQPSLQSTPPTNWPAISANTTYWLSPPPSHQSLVHQQHQIWSLQLLQNHLRECKIQLPWP